MYVLLIRLALFQCKYDFCWVCQEQWKKHSSATGGYFRCNRYEVLKKVDDNTKLAKAEVNSLLTLFAFST